MTKKKYVLFAGLLVMMFVSACGFETQDVSHKAKSIVAKPAVKVGIPDPSDTPEKLFCESRKASCSCPTMLPRLVKCEYHWNASAGTCELIKVCLP